jgi:uncharacterized repeat protein (TIGR01451 family)
MSTQPVPCSSRVFLQTLLTSVVLLVGGFAATPAWGQVSSCGVSVSNQAEISYGEAGAILGGRSNLLNLTAQNIDALVQVQLTQVRTGNGSALPAVQLGQLTLSLQALGYTEAEAMTGSNAIAIALAQQVETTVPELRMQAARSALSQAVPAKSNLAQSLSTDAESQIRELSTLLVGGQDYRNGTQSGNTVLYEFVLTNYSANEQTVPLRGLPSNLAQPLTLPARSQVRLVITVTLGSASSAGGLVSMSLAAQNQGLQVTLTGPATPTAVQMTALPANPNIPGNIVCPTPVPLARATLLIPPSGGLVDPLGRLTGCNGELLADYRGFSVGLYNPNLNDPTGGLASLVGLTPTGPNTPYVGLVPNASNSNPFFLSSGEQGKYNFQLDLGRGQLDPGDTYILVVNPPQGSIYNQRRIRLVITSRVRDLVTYTATALDGQPISTSDGATTVTGTLTVNDAATVGLVLGVLSLRTNICQAQEIQISKTGDRVSAQPGDTVIYRLSVRNLSPSALNNLQVIDQLPLGFNYRPDSLRAELAGNQVTLNASRSGSTLTLTAPQLTLPAGQTLNIAYAATLTPDALRGSGINIATVQGQQTQSPFRIVRDGPAKFRVRPQAGMFFDSGTIIGRVFEDLNSDGEQQVGEPGIPHAVIFLEDGNRITTDVNGLFSVANVLPGYHTGVLDLSSIPGYTFAENQRFKERNSQSRLVQLAPGGMVRMNFGVRRLSPTAPGGKP